MTRGTLLLVSAGLCIGVSAASAQVSKQGARYLFRLHLTQGEKLNFKVPFSISGLADQPMYFHFGMRMKVLSVSKTGKATVHCDVDTGKIPLPGNAPKNGSFDVDQRGRVGDEGSAPVGFCVLYPKDPVPIGGTFVAPVPSAVGGSLGGGVGGAQATFTFVGLSDFEGKRVARLTFHVTGNKDPGGSILIRVSDGVIQKYFTTFIALTPQAGKPVTVSATILRY